MANVRPKKHLGQHFLKDLNIASNIADGLTGHGGYKQVLEIGPGTGVLTQFLLPKDYETWVIDIDRDSIAYLEKHFSETKLPFCGCVSNMYPTAFLYNDRRLVSGFSFSRDCRFAVASQISFRQLFIRMVASFLFCLLVKIVVSRLRLKFVSESFLVMLASFPDNVR